MNASETTGGKDFDTRHVGEDHRSSYRGAAIEVLAR